METGFWLSRTLFGSFGATIIWQKLHTSFMFFPFKAKFDEHAVLLDESWNLAVLYPIPDSEQAVPMERYLPKGHCFVSRRDNLLTRKAQSIHGILPPKRIDLGQGRCLASIPLHSSPFEPPHKSLPHGRTENALVHSFELVHTYLKVILYSHLIILLNETLVAYLA